MPYVPIAWDAGFRSPADGGAYGDNPYWNALAA